MDSPKSDGNAADSEPSFPACSLLSQKSPISKFLSNLSPIDSARTSQYRQRLSESSFPANPSVFGSPHSDLQRDSNFLKRKEIANSSSNGHGQCYSRSSSATKHMVLGSLSLVEDKIWGLPSQNIWNHDHVQSDELLEHHVDQEAFQHQQGIRRHLQFEGIFNGKVDAAFGCHASSDSFSFNENGGNQATPSHPRMGLSNVANSLPVGSIKKLAAYQSSQEKYIAERGSYLKDISDSLISTGREVFDNVDSDSNEAVIVHHGGQLVDKKLPWDPQQALCFERQTLPGDGKISGQQLIERVEESQCQDNSKAKRKKEYMDESDGCKRCNCKRSKCLKLYCECFAAGFYCVDSCACENCYNKPEYEDTVSDVREQIQLRNPLAFAPTVVKQANNSPIVVDDPKWTSSSSARHKRGCKCKRSKCLKKYCECYRAKVGCSDGCRCEDCDNYFGKKSESIFGAEKWKNPSHEKLITTEVLSDHVNGRIPNQFSPTWGELVNLSHLTPFSHAHSRAVPSSTSFDMGDIANVSQAQSQEGNGFQLLPGQFHWHSSALTPTLACVRKSPHEFGSTNATYDVFGSPKMLIDNCNSTNTLKAHSPNQKRVSPPQLQSDRLDSSSKPGLQSCRKLNLQAVDSSPLTPYCNSEDCMNQKENDHQGSSHDFECQE